MRKLSGYGPSLIVLATAMLVLFLGPSAVRQLTFKQTEARIIQAQHRLDGENILAQLNAAYRDIAMLVEPSVVHISAQQDAWNRRASVSSGSGWIYDDDGHVVTNHHVVRDAERIDVQLASGENRPATIVGFDRSTDIAVLRIEPGHLHPAVRSQTDRGVHQGDLVFAFGSPFDFRFSMSSGVISGMGRSVDVLGPTGYENFIQVDAAINPGNSGGPLTDYRGRVIGMNTAIATGGRQSSLEEGQFAGVGLAIPMGMIEPVVEQIINNGGVVEKGLLGVSPTRLVINDARRLGFTGTGVRITDVQPGLPADRAGVRVNDIVTAVNGLAVESPDQLRSIVSSMLPGEIAMLSIWRPNPDRRGGETMEVRVQLVRLDPLLHNGMLPEDQPRDRIPELGIARMADSTPDRAGELGIEHLPGVLIEGLVPGSPLADLVAPGTIIVNVMGHSVRDVDDFLTILRENNLRRGVRVGVILPDGSVRSVVLAVGP
ncbi:MAG: PDZ domain-containing protein [Planctomycetes bacterium]|nr:PDZ domain-containing protein [Planctomycetota bacterium]